MSLATRTRRINIYINGKQVSNDIASISAAIAKLNNETKHLDIGSRQYVENMRKIRELKGVIYEHNMALNATTHNLFTLKGLANAFNKYWPVIMGTIGTIAGLIFNVKSVTEEFASFDDKLSDIMKTTGLSREEVAMLNEEFKNIDTRTAQDELLDLAYVAGKLGITTVDEILGFVRASDKIVVALQKDLGGSAEDAINTLGKLVQVFKLKEEYGMEEAMLKVGSSINSLGMASSANEENIVGFSKRVAGIGKLANIQVPHILGLGATIDALAISTEVGATAYSMFMGRMTQDTATFATIAGMKLDDFVALLNTDANEAFIRVLEALNNTGEGFTALRSSMEAAGLDGERAVAVMSTLSQQTDFLRQQQELSNKAFILGTSVIDEFNIKNNSAQAIIDKNVKKINEQRVALGEKLMPVYASGQSALVKFYQTIGVLVNFLSEYGKGLIVATSALIGYKLAMMATAIWNERLVAGTRAFAIAEAFSSMQTKLATKWLLMKGIAYDLYRGKVNLATAATEIFSLALGMTGLPALIALLATAASSFWLFSSASKNASKETLNLADEIERLTKEKQKNIVNEQVELKLLISTITGLNEKSKLRVALIQQLKEKYPELIGYIEADKVKNEQLNIVIETLNTNIRERIKLAALEAKAEAYKNKMIDTASQMLTIESEILKVNEKYNKISSTRQLSLKEEQWRRQELNQLTVKYNILADEQLALENDYLNLINDVQSQNKTIANQRETQLRKQLDLLRQKNAEEEKSASPDKQAISERQREIAQLERMIGLIHQQAKAEDEWSEIKENEAKNAELKRYNKEKSDRLTHEQNLRKIELQFMQGRLDNWQIEADERVKLENKKEEKIAEIREAYDKADDKKKGYKLKKDFDFMQASTQLYKDFMAGRIATSQELEDKLLQLEIDHLRDKLNAEEFGTDEYIQLDAQLQNKLFTQFNNRVEREKTLRKASITDELDEVREKYQQQLIELGIFGMKVEEMTASQQKAYAAVMANANAEFNQIDAKRIKDFFDQRGEAYQNELAQLKLAHTQQQNEVGNDRKKRKELRAQQSKELIELTKEYFDETMLIINKLKETGGFDGINLSDDILSDPEFQIILEKYTELLEKMGKLKEKFSSDFGFSNQDLLGFSLSDWERFIDNIQKKWNELDFEEKFETIAVGLLAVSDLSKQYFDLVKAYEDKAIDKTEEKYDAEKAALSKQLEFGLISQENYDAKVAEMDAELDRKKAELARKQAVREKAAAIFEATINGALAVIKAMPNPILAAIVGGIVATQIAMIAATPLPEVPGAETGGMLVQRAQDGKRFNASYNPRKRGYINRPTVIVSENGEEYVVPGDAMKNPTARPLLDLFETARLNGNLATIDFNEMLAKSIYGKQAGGLVSISSDTKKIPLSKLGNTQNNALFELLINAVQNNTNAIDELNLKLQKPFKGYVNLHGSNGLYEAMEEDQTIKDNANL